jgi:predicted transcriptional regulator
MKAELKLKTCQVALDGAPDEIADLIRRVEMETIVLASQSPETELNEAKKISGITAFAQSKPKKAIIEQEKTRGSRGTFPEAEFIKLYNAGKTANEIAGLLNVNQAAIYNHTYTLVRAGKIKKRSLPQTKKPKNGKQSIKPWSDDELRQLKEMAGYNELLKEMAKFLERPEPEVKAKLQELANKGIIKNTTTALLENVTA